MLILSPLLISRTELTPENCMNIIETNCVQVLKPLHDLSDL